MERPTRRELIQVTTASIVGFATTTKAKETDRVEKSNEGSVGENHSIPYDLRVLNNTPEESHLQVQFDPETDDSRKTSIGEAQDATPTSNRFELGPDGATVATSQRSNAAEQRLDLQEGAYAIRASTTDGLSESIDFYVPEGGIPHWVGVKVRLLPHERIDIGVVEV